MVDGGEAVDQEGKIARHCELDKEDLACSRCHQGSGWLATPQGCRLLAQVLTFSSKTRTTNFPKKTPK